MVKRVLITGASGFIGSHTVEHILKTTDWEIVALVRGKNIGDNNRLLDNQANLPYLKRLKIVRVDLADGINPTKDAEIGHIDYVIHLAANSHVDRSITHPKEFFEDNVIGTVNLLDWARARNGKGDINDPRTYYGKIEKIINAGTDEVFGPVKNGVPFAEDAPFHPSNPYSAAKAGQVCAGESYFVTFKLPIVTTFMVNIFGERQNSEKLIPRAINKILAGEPMIIHCKKEDDGAVSEIGIRCWMHARSAADAYLFLLEHGVVGERYNIEAGVRKDNVEVVETIANILGKEVEFEYVDFHKSRPGHDREYGLNGDKIRALGWVQKVSFEEALKHVVEWTLANPEASR
jgi:dTDP-glucose 4,6-dehydratase